MKNTALIFSGIIFSLVSFAHFLRYVRQWEIVFNHFTVPVEWSMYAGIIIAALAVWMFVAAAKR